jgi:type I restriction enzyme S subunit
MSGAVSAFKYSGRGTTIDGVTKKQLLDVDLKLAPLPEQRRIVAAVEEQFSRLDAGMAALERVRTNLKRYRTATLKAAVEGRLTEAWREENPSVEPASELLERILKARRDRWERVVLDLRRATSHPVDDQRHLREGLGRSSWRSGFTPQRDVRSRVRLRGPQIHPD